MDEQIEELLSEMQLMLTETHNLVEQNKQMLEVDRQFQREMTKTLADLVSKSEQRMDRINAMILELIKSQANDSRVLTQITESYASHLKSLSDNRDATQDENLNLTIALKEHEKALTLLANAMQGGVKNFIQPPTPK